MIRAMIFDLDGTLVQTERLKAISYARAAAELRPDVVTEAAVVSAFRDVVGLSRSEVVPSGNPTEATINALADRFAPGDTIIDGGNSNYKDSMRRGAALQARGLHFVDVGTSGGIWGLAEGYSLMVGGDEQVVERLRPIFETLAPAPDKG